MALHLLSCLWDGCLPVQAKVPAAEKEKPSQQRRTLGENQTTVWLPSWSFFSTIPRSTCDMSSFPMSSQLFPSHDNSLFRSTRGKVRGRFGGHAARGVSAFPSSRVSLESLSRASLSLAEIRGYSQCWTVTLLLAFLAVTINTFYFNKFIILRAYVLLWSDCTTPDPGKMHKKLSKIT